jgi:hypothetical protein
MFGLGQKRTEEEEQLPGDQVKRLQQLEASAFLAHMQLSELLKTIKHPSPFEIQPALRRIEMADAALVDYARQSGLV